MLPEGHKPVCRACYDLDCDNCADKHRTPVFAKCECGCNEQPKETVKVNVYKLDLVDSNSVRV